MQIDPGPMPHLDRVRPRLHQGPRPLGRRHVAGDHVDRRSVRLMRRHGIDDVAGMAVGRIDHQHVHAGPDQRLGPLVVVDAHRRPDAQPASAVLAGVGEVGELVDVLDRDEALQFIVIVHQQQFLDLIFR